ncbi:MAG TPA: ATP-binding protein, partial [Phycisphaerae bacterium]|nr:ATP-binding protein [Phycisphaerae bacterium]
MTRSLRSRLIVGMLAGMAVLLLAASTTIYTVQRRQLYRAFDDTLLNSANALTLMVHPGPFGLWFDVEGLGKLPAGRIHQGALYQLWSDNPIALPPPPEDETSRLEALSRNQPMGEAPPLSGQGPRQESERPLGPPPNRGPPPPEPPFRGPRPPPGGPASRPFFEGPELELMRPEGQVVVRSPLLNGADLPRLDVPVGGHCVEKITLPDGTSGRAIGIQTELPSPPPEFRLSPPAKLTTVVAADTAEIDQQLHFLAVLLLITAVGTMAVSGGVAWLVVTGGLRPLDQVAQKMAVMDETALKERITAHGIPLEIKPVVDQLNGLLERLDGAFDRERALTADVAHELRTPVAEIRAIADITLSRERDPRDYREALSETQAAIMTLQGLIEKLLVLARLEAGQVRPELEAIALRPLVAQHWTQVRGHADARGIRFDNLCLPDAMVIADHGFLDIVLTNVLSNAAAYTSDGGCISVECQGSEGRCSLSVANTGCTLTADQADRVFDRFWRADTARSKTGLNCGLGLTLVRRAMEAMGGSAA